MASRLPNGRRIISAVVVDARPQRMAGRVVMHDMTAVQHMRHIPGRRRYHRPISMCHGLVAVATEPRTGRYVQVERVVDDGQQIRQERLEADVQPLLDGREQCGPIRWNARGGITVVTRNPGGRRDQWTDDQQQCGQSVFGCQDLGNRERRLLLIGIDYVTELYHYDSSRDGFESISDDFAGK